MVRELFRMTGIGAIATVLSIGAASAADLAPVVVPAAPPVVVTPAPAGFDFAGPYVGIVVEPVFLPGFGGVDWVNIQGQAGFNIVPGRMLIGGEVKVGAYVLSGVGLAVDADARVGVILRDNILVYATAGAGFYGPGFGDLHINFGGGVEVGLGSRVSLQLEVGGEWFQGPPIYPRVEIGMNFHFGR
jgi:hypothetical protein